MKININSITGFFSSNVSSKEVDFLIQKISNVKECTIRAKDISRLTKTMARTRNENKVNKIRSILEWNDKKLAVMDPLLGKSISPNFLFDNNLDGKIRVNGFGEITGFTTKLSDENRKLVLANVISPLKMRQENKPSIRTPHSAIIDIAAKIKYSCIAAEKKNIELHLLREIYFRGGANKAYIQGYVDSLRSDRDYDDVIPDLEKIIDTIPARVPKTLANDNLYGRNFDSNLAEYVLNERVQCEYLKRNSQEIRDFLKQELLRQSPSENEVLYLIRDMMVDDPQPWREKIPESRFFITNPSRESFFKMLDSDHMFSGMLISSVAVKALCAYPSLAGIKEAATKRYSMRIEPERVLINNMSGQSNESGRTGLLLSYQYDSLVGSNDNVGVGVRPIDRYVLPATYKEDCEHNKISIRRGRAVGIGLSGSSNLLEYLFKYIKNDNSKFDMDAARLQAATFLTFSGGHSINEAYNVFYSKPDMLKPVSYDELRMVSPMHEEAILYAYDKNLELSKFINKW